MSMDFGMLHTLYWYAWKENQRREEEAKRLNKEGGLDPSTLAEELEDLT